MSNARLSKRQRRPTHPGELLREAIMPGIGITHGELAKRMCVSRRLVDEICQERRGVTADMADRLARVLNTTPYVWMNMQAAVDIWDAMKANQALSDDHTFKGGPENQLLIRGRKRDC